MEVGPLLLTAAFELDSAMGFEKRKSLNSLSVIDCESPSPSRASVVRAVLNRLCGYPTYAPSPARATSTPMGFSRHSARRGRPGTPSVAYIADR